MSATTFRGIKHVVSYSGGKDSAATLGLALERCSREDVIVVFADTDNEHEITLQHLDDTERALGITITRLRNDFSERIRRKRLFIARALDRLMLAIGDRLAARENVLLPTVGVIEAGPVRKIDGQYYVRIHRARVARS